MLLWVVFYMVYLDNDPIPCYTLNIISYETQIYCLQMHFSTTKISFDTFRIIPNHYNISERESGSFWILVSVEDELDDLSAIIPIS